MENKENKENNVWTDEPHGNAGESGRTDNTVETGQKQISAVSDTEETKRLKANFGSIAPWALIYSVFYAFCMYRNGSGVTFPFFVAGSLLFFGFSLSKLGIILKKGSCCYIAAMLLLGISTFCTDDGFLIFCNKLGIFLLLMSFLLKQFYDTAGWRLFKYMSSICLLVCASFGELGRPVSDGREYRRRRGKKTDKRILYIAAGLLAGVPLLAVVFLLLASADAVFRQMTDRLLQNLYLGDIFGVLFRIGILFFASYALTAYLCRRKIRENVTNTRRGEPILAITVTALLTGVYLIFSGIQIMGLFLGQLRLPEGYTYAMYAREGFFQLLFVSLLNLVIVLCCLGFFRESRVLKCILTVMSLCTFVMIASSAMRMVMYVRYYYLTYLRILVLWALAVLALLFAGVIANILRGNFPLFRYQMAVVAVLYLVLSFAHPDYIIAKVNLANASPGTAWDQSEDSRGSDQTASLNFSAVHEKKDAGSEYTKKGQSGFFLAAEPYQDYGYLMGLSADAAPVLVPCLQEMGYQMEAFYAENAVNYAAEHAPQEDGQIGAGYFWLRRMQRRTENFGLRSYNLSRHLALRYIGGR